MNRVCFNCAYCSELYPSFKDVCDLDDHIINDVFKETCNNFLESEDEENGAVPG